MKDYRITEEVKVIKHKELLSATCDVCGKTYDTETDIFEIQEFQTIRVSGGFGSVFGDGDVYELDICQSCLKERLGKYFRFIDSFYWLNIFVETHNAPENVRNLVKKYENKAYVIYG